MISFMVMFHAMARRTADWWPLTFDISRSQSGLRVATTAAPVTASELEQSVAEMRGADVLEEVAAMEERKRRVSEAAAAAVWWCLFVLELEMTFCAAGLLLLIRRSIDACM